MNELYRQYEADKALVWADPELTAADKARLITQLTDALLEAEAAMNICWEPLFGVYVSAATEDGSAEFLRDPKKHAQTERKEKVLSSNEVGVEVWGHLRSNPIF